jgi:hypothetical protein
MHTAEWEMIHAHASQLKAIIWGVTYLGTIPMRHSESVRLGGSDPRLIGEIESG